LQVSRAILLAYCISDRLVAKREACRSGAGSLDPFTRILAATCGAWGKTSGLGSACRPPRISSRRPNGKEERGGLLFRQLLISCPLKPVEKCRRRKEPINPPERIVVCWGRSGPSFSRRMRKVRIPLRGRQGGRAMVKAGTEKPVPGIGPPWMGRKTVSPADMRE
jgi:hypothetical protein